MYWLLSFSIMLIHVLAYINNPFLLVLNSIPFYGYIRVCGVFIHLLMNIWIVFSFGAVTRKTPVNIHVKLFLQTSAFLLDQYISRSGMFATYIRCVEHFIKLPKCFFRELGPYYIHQVLIPILASTRYNLPFNFSQSDRDVVISVVVLICISLMTNSVECFFTCLLRISLLAKH